MARAKVERAEVDEVILGQVLAAGQGQNPARQAAINAGIPKEKTAWGLNQLCGSGLRAVALGMQQIANGDAEIIVAGGQESMSQAPHAAYLRAGTKMGDLKFIDTMLKDGLWDAFNGYHMGTTAENVAAKWQITREEQDKFAVASQNKAEAAQKAGKFKDEIAPVHDQDPQGRHRRRPGRIHPRRRDARRRRQAAARLLEGRHGDRRQRLRHQRRRRRGGADDGRGGREARHDAARPHRLLGDRRRRSGDHGHRPDPGLAQGAGEGRLEGRRPRPRRGQRGLRRAGLAVNKDMGWDPENVNVNGGAIAIGHPIGASGARVLITLLHEMRRRDAKKGLATLCIGGGMGVAMCVER